MATKTAKKTVKKSAEPARPKRKRRAMSPPLKIEKGVSAADLPLVGMGPGSTYTGIFKEFSALKHENPKTATMTLSPPSDVEQSRYRNNLTAAFRGWLGCALRGHVSIRLVADGRVAVTKLSEVPKTAKPLI